MPIENDKTEKSVDNKGKTQDTGRNATPKEVSKPDKPEVQQEEENIPQSYVWLANGEVRLCNDDDLPIGSGDSQFGHWQEGNKVHTIVAVYPIEETVKGE